MVLVRIAIQLTDWLDLLGHRAAGEHANQSVRGRRCVRPRLRDERGLRDADCSRDPDVGGWFGGRGQESNFGPETHIGGERFSEFRALL